MWDNASLMADPEAPPIDDVPLDDESAIADAALLDEAPASVAPAESPAESENPVEEDVPYATHWREIYPRTPQSMGRSIALSSMGSWLTLSGKASSLLAQPRVQVLLLHHVFEDEEPRFRRLLKFLSRTHALVNYGEALKRATSGGAEVDRPFLALTFDDGFKNCARAGEILGEFNATACFFICPTMIGENDLVKLQSFCRDRLELRGKPVEFMDADDLEKLKKAGHEIGGHTMTHANLAKITPQQANDEISTCFDVLKRNFGEAKHFAWTYGKFTDCTPDAARAVFQAGFVSCASGERGCHGPNRMATNQPLCVRRDHIIAGAPLTHARYVLAKSSATMSPHSGDWPPWWGEVRSLPLAA
jgi:peptidoglycan/xylan/chitin deacetylase (PgdA/CDA1 family)